MSAATEMVFDLLVTWGATARPAAVELFQVLEERTAPGGIDLLRQVLAAPEGLIDAELRQEISALRDAVDARDAKPAELESRLGRVVDRLTDDLDRRTAARSEKLNVDFRAWAPVLDAPELKQFLAELWSVEDADDPVARLEALRRLDGLQERLEHLGSRRLEEMEKNAEALPEGSDLLQAAREAVASGDPEALARAREELQRLRGRGERQKIVARLERARDELRQLCVRCREKDGLALDGRSRGLLAEAVEAAGSAAAATDDADPAARLEAVEIHAASLAAMLEDIDGSVDAARRRREELARDVAERLGTLPGDEVDRAVTQALLDGAANGGRAFSDALDRSLALLREGQPAADQELPRPLKELRKQAAALTELLENSADVLPTERVVRARILAERVETAVAAREVEGVDSLADAIVRGREQIEALAERQRKARSGRGEAIRQRLLSRASRSRPLVGGREGARLQKLAHELERAAPAALEELELELLDIVLPAENAVRCEAARVLDGLRRAKRGSEDDVRSLETALEQDDLESMARLAGELRGAIAGGPLSRPTVRIAVAGLALVLLAGAVWVWRTRSGGPTDYVLRLDPAHQATGAITLTVVRDGRVQDRQTYDPASGATFRLAPGEYEVFVNDRYTGRTIRAPTDPREVTMIPVPPAP